MTFPIQIRQSKKCGSVRNDEIMNLPWDLVQALESAFPTYCKASATFIDSICLKESTGKKTKNPEMRSNSNKSYCTALTYVHRTQIKRSRLGT